MADRTTCSGKTRAHFTLRPHGDCKRKEQDRGKLDDKRSEIGE